MEGDCLYSFSGNFQYELGFGSKPPWLWRYSRLYQLIESFNWSWIPGLCPLGWNPALDRLSELPYPRLDRSYKYQSETGLTATKKFNQSELVQTKKMYFSPVLRQLQKTRLTEKQTGLWTPLPLEYNNERPSVHLQRCLQKFVNGSIFEVFLKLITS